MARFARVRVRENNQSKKVRISSENKPSIQENVIVKWQSLIDTAARIVNVPSGLIMKLNQETIEVFLKSNTSGNPYKKGEKADLVYGLYCETVIGTQKKLLVPDARKSKVWGKDNPDVDINMISYLGFPINWPDGEVFGTVCLLDNKENHFSKDYEELLWQIKEHVENDLQLLILHQDLMEKNDRLEQMSNTRSRFLSLISHDIRGNIATIDEFLKLILEDLDEYDNDSLRPVLESLSQNTSVSREALEDMLSWSKKDLIDLQADNEDVNIIDVLDNILGYFRQNTLLKDIRIKTSFYSPEAVINTDRNMLTAALRNIISNAIKYNYKHGEINISVGLKNDKHEISIADTGTGMTEDTLKSLFDYSKDHRSGTQGESSAGIGLMLTKEFIDKLGAEISVSSKPGEGSSFTVRI